MKSTDNQNELFDIVDEDDNVVGKATRGEVHKNKNLIHRSVGVIVFDSRGRVFLQQRSATKDTDPLKWTISASGHVNTKIKDQRSKIKNTCLAGRQADQKSKIYEEAAHRELKEELGIDLEIEPVCKYICREPNETEIQMVYKAYSDGPFKLHRDEIEQGKFFTRNELVRLVKLGKLEMSFSGKIAIKKIGWI